MTDKYASQFVKKECIMTSIIQDNVNHIVATFMSMKMIYIECVNKLEIAHS